MTLIEIGWLAISLTAGYVGWLVGSHYFGWPFGVITAIAGFFLPLIFLWIIATIMSFLFFPPPMCENAKCVRWKDFRFVGLIGSDVEYVCNCGMHYASSGRRFLKVVNGQPESYKQRDVLGKWRDDRGAH